LSSPSAPTIAASDDADGPQRRAPSGLGLRVRRLGKHGYRRPARYVPSATGPVKELFPARDRRRGRTGGRDSAGRYEHLGVPGARDASVPGCARLMLDSRSVEAHGFYWREFFDLYPTRETRFANAAGRLALAVLVVSTEPERGGVEIGDDQGRVGGRRAFPDPPARGRQRAEHP
jgi:hypothetical protein